MYTKTTPTTTVYTLYTEARRQETQNLIKLKKKFKTKRNH